jgi:hypothetical protein
MEEDDGIEEALDQEIEEDDGMDEDEGMEEILGEKISDDVEDSDISEPTPFDSENEKG